MVNRFLLHRIRGLGPIAARHNSMHTRPAQRDGRLSHARYVLTSEHTEEMAVL